MGRIVRAVTLTAVCASLLVGVGGCGEDKPARMLSHDDKGSLYPTYSAGRHHKKKHDKPGDATPGAETSDHATADSGPMSEAEVAALFAEGRAALEQTRYEHTTMQFVTPQLTGTMVRESDYTTDPMSSRMVVEAAGQFAGEFRVVEGVSYAKVPAMTGDKFQMTGSQDQTGSPGDAGGSDPETMLGVGQDSIDNLTFVGTETRSRVEVRHYRGVMDSTALPQFPGVGELPSKVTTNFWVDDLGRTTEMSMETPTFTMTSISTGWDDPVNVEAPSASEIITP